MASSGPIAISKAFALSKKKFFQFLIKPSGAYSTDPLGFNPHGHPFESTAIFYIPQWISSQPSFFQTEIILPPPRES